MTAVVIIRCRSTKHTAMSRVKSRPQFAARMVACFTIPANTDTEVGRVTIIAHDFGRRRWCAGGPYTALSGRLPFTARIETGACYQYPRSSTGKSNSLLRNRLAVRTGPWVPLFGGLRFAYGTGIGYTPYRATILRVAALANCNRDHSGGVMMVDALNRLDAHGVVPMSSGFRGLCVSSLNLCADTGLSRFACVGEGGWRNMNTPRRTPPARKIGDGTGNRHEALHITVRRVYVTCGA